MNKLCAFLKTIFSSIGFKLDTKKNLAGTFIHFKRRKMKMNNKIVKIMTMMMIRIIIKKV